MWVIADTAPRSPSHSAPAVPDAGVRTSAYSVNMVNERILSKRLAARSSQPIRKHPW